MDVGPNPPASDGSVYLNEAHASAWAGVRRARPAPKPQLRVGVAAWALFGVAGLSLLFCAGAAANLAAAQAQARAAAIAEAAAEAEPDAPAQAQAQAPVIALEGAPSQVDAGDGVAVQPVAAPRPLTVRERVTLRSSPGGAADRGAIRPGQRLRVIGQLRHDGELWLQVRADDGGVAYMVAENAVYHDAWRRAQSVIAQASQAEPLATEGEATANGALATTGAPLTQIDVPPPEAGPPPETEVLY